MQGLILVLTQYTNASVKTFGTCKEINDGSLLAQLDFHYQENKTVTFSFLTKHDLNIHIPVLLHILSKKADRKMQILLFSTVGLDLYFIGLSVGIVKFSIMCGYEVLRHITTCGKILLFYKHYYRTGFLDVDCSILKGSDILARPLGSL